MRLRAYRIAYDGTPYRGFQRQPDVPTVEDAIFDALGDLSVLEAGAAKPAGYAAAGRTDAGVSALAQTVAFEAPGWLTPRAFTSRLPASIRAWAVATATDGFHATHDATERTYTYHLHAPPDSIDDDRLETALECLSGTHDVHNLTPDDRNTERTLALEATRAGDFLVLTARAGGFSRELVRRLVTLLERVARGETPLETIDRVLAPDPLPGHEGIPPAPPAPLVLTDVTYPDLDFSVDETAAEGALAYFRERRRERAAAVRVAGHLGSGIEAARSRD